MSIDLTKTVRIVRQPKVALDERGHNVWVGEVETAEFELVSTVMLQTIMESDNEQQKQQLRDAATGADGVLAIDPDKERFEIVDDDDLMAALRGAVDSDPDTADVQVETVDDEPENFELVSTQMLRAILQTDAVEDKDDADAVAFDPYNSS